MKANLKITGMHCRSCEMLINDALLDSGVKNCKIDSKRGTAVIEFDEKKLNLPKIKSIIEKEGYKVA